MPALDEGSDQMPYDHITFTSDYGLDDEFVGVCHGVIAQIAPGARVIDIAHRIPPFDVRAGALVLVRAIQYMPPGVHLAIVDPGVGTDRRSIAVEVEGSVFVGPDNGLLSPAVAMLGGATRAAEISNPEYRLSGSGGVTFAGRDVLAPAAAQLAIGTPLLDLGPEISPHLLIPTALPLSAVEGDVVSGEVLWIDRFGNAQLNIDPGDLELLGISSGDEVEIVVGGSSRLAMLGAAFDDDEQGRLLIVIDSYGLLSLAVNRGRASDSVGVSAGTAVRLRKPEPGPAD